MKKIPIGIEDFSLMRQDDFLYIDKTDELKKLITNGQRYFLSRAKGFGKSVMLSALRAIFRGQSELFTGLASESFVKKFSEKPYPVIFFDLFHLDAENTHTFDESLNEIICNVYNEFEIQGKSTSTKSKLIYLFENVYKKFGYFVILVDNYDKVIFDSLRDTKLMAHIYNGMKRFYSAIEGCNKYIKFLMITGEKSFERSGIFSTIYGISDISNKAEYQNIVGFTDIEIELAAKKSQISYDAYTKIVTGRRNAESCYNALAVLEMLDTEGANLSSVSQTYPQIYACINQGDALFLEAKNSKIYIDKSELLAITNTFLETDHKYICISRPRRFGKTISVNMLSAYYDITSNARETFKSLKFANSPSFATYANKYIVIKLTIQTYLSLAHDIDKLIDLIEDDIKVDLCKQYGFEFIDYNINTIMGSITSSTGRKFIIAIDEWDCILREFKDKDAWQKKYLDFLRYLFKDQAHIALVYMTGILPIKKYGTHSALNMFDEYSMLGADPFTEFIGFTENEVLDLCKTYKRDFLEFKRWYDGYQVGSFTSIYNPRSVNCCISTGEFKTYWNNTETYEALRLYISMAYEGLHDAITLLLANGSVPVNTATFTNDMKTFHSMEDILTLLVHLGYLSFDRSHGCVRIPNSEIAQEFVTAIQNGGWSKVVQAIKNSETLLFALLNGDSKTVAKGIEEAHEEMSFLQYNDENALAYTIALAFFAARQWYTMVREFPTGKGFADLVFLPRPNTPYPALCIELKWNKGAHAALAQILARNYPASLIALRGSVVLAGITYDKKSKHHSCVIMLDREPC